MQTVKASTILDDAYRLIGWDAGQIDSRDKADARCALSKAIQEVWDRWWWNELMICQQRQCARTYDANTVYQAGEFVWFPPSDKYYQKLLVTANENTSGYGADFAPAQDTGGGYSVNAEFWVEATPSWTLRPYSASETYLTGDKRKALTDGAPYQFATGFTVTAATVVEANGSYTWSGNFAGFPFYEMDVGGVIVAEIYMDVGAFSLWTLVTVAGGITYVEAAPGGAATPADVTNWNGPGDSPVFSTQEAPPAAAHWRALEEFTPSLPYTFGGIDYEVSGPVRMIAKFDPRVRPNAHEYEFESTLDGVRITNLDVGRPWVWSRRFTPIIDADEWDGTVAYTADENLVFDD